jgi:hypothetical protein
MFLGLSDKAKPKGKQKMKISNQGLYFYPGQSFPVWENGELINKADIMRVMKQHRSAFKRAAKRARKAGKGRLSVNLPSLPAVLTAVPRHLYKNAKQGHWYTNL